MEKITKMVKLHTPGKTLTSLVALSLILSLSACNKQESGTLIGAIAGAAVGSSVGGHGHGRRGHGGGNAFAMIVGAMAGAAIGSSIGKSLDRADQIAMQQTSQHSLESSQSGTVSKWHNPDSGHYGSITPQPGYKNNKGKYCREYQQTITVGGKTETAYGTACRQPDGAWKIIQG